MDKDKEIARLKEKIEELEEIIIEMPDCDNCDMRDEPKYNEGHY